MSLIALPASFRPENFTMWLATTQRSAASPFGGSEQVVDLMNDRWLISLALPKGTHQTAASNEAFLNSLRGMTNTVLLWHMARPVPQGSMRGSPVMAAPAAQGTNALLVQTTPGATLQVGDLIGLGGLLLQVSLDCVADGAGVMVVYIVNRLRKAQITGAAVTWSRPTAAFRKSSDAAAFRYSFGYAEGTSIDLMEVVA